MWLLARRLAAARNDRERMLRTAIEASDVERRRISRDLHDGVVQDLAGASYTLAATARTLADSRPETSATLAAQASSIRSALRSLRSLLVEIYPADLHEHGLAAALEDLVAPAAGAGIDVGLTVGDTEELPPEVAALVWRVAQEAVRNALRHAAPTTLRVTVTGPADGTRGGQCDLVVVDDGAGFDPSRPTPAGHLGLRAMRDLVAEAGGRLRIDSVVGAGTTVRLTVPTP